MDLPKNLGLVKLPAALDIALYLIKAELKHRKFIKGLEQIGFDSGICSLDFSSLILKLTGFEVISDDTFEKYNDLLESFIQQIGIREDEARLTSIALEFYQTLEKHKTGQK
jgi:hypothetical protein